jgi:hypothetical protein
MPLTTRQGKGDKLTIEEMDGNLTYLQGLARPYKIYTALLTQTGTDAPIPTVLENTFTGSISFLREAVGQYRITSSASEFSLNKTLTQVQVWGDKPAEGRVGIVQYATSDRLLLYVAKDVVPADRGDTIGTNNIITSIEIRVYP